jgi:two-component system response regulator HydG
MYSPAVLLQPARMHLHVPPVPDPFDCILGDSSAAGSMRTFGRRAAGVDATVLLTGESGTGKSLLAGAIHAASARVRGPFVSVNCAGVPETLFESEFFGHVRGAFTGAHQQHRGHFERADRGTIFLDEVAELTAPLQAKLLTTLEEGEVRRVGSERVVRVDFRAIAATGADLHEAVAAGRFRRDLYHRLLVLSHRLPALRERLDDLPGLCDYYLERFCRRYRRPLNGLDSAAMTRLHAHAWPGNIRELAHALESAVLQCEEGRIGLRHLPETVRMPAFHSEVTSARSGSRYAFYGGPAEERRRIEEAMRLCAGNKTRAAAMLGMARNTLRAKLRMHDLP